MTAFLEEGPYDLPVVLDPEGDIASAYRIRGIPTIVVVDSDGRVAGVNVGLTRASRLTQMVEAAR